MCVCPPSNEIKTRRKLCIMRFFFSLSLYKQWQWARALAPLICSILLLLGEKRISFLFAKILFYHKHSHMHEHFTAYVTEKQTHMMEMNTMRITIY